MPLNDGAILLADDDDIVRDMCGLMLKRLGFRVFLAENGEEAVKICREHGQLLACVILDMLMPRMDGVSAFKQIRGICPKVKVILSSGYGKRDVMEHLEEVGVDGFMEKPYAMKSLFKELSKVLQYDS